MARDIYSLRIFAHASLQSGAGNVGPFVPTGFVYIVRDMDVNETSGTNGSLLIVRNQVSGNLWTPTRSTTTTAKDWQWRGRQVYSEGEQVVFFAASGTWAIACSGYQLTLP